MFPLSIDEFDEFDELDSVMAVCNCICLAAFCPIPYCNYPNEFQSNYQFSVFDANRASGQTSNYT